MLLEGGPRLSPSMSSALAQLGFNVIVAALILIARPKE